MGAELEGAAALPWNLQLAGNVTLSYNRLVRYAMLDEAGLPVRLDGNPIAGFPDLLGNLRLSWRGERLTASLAAQYVGPFYTDNFRDPANRTDGSLVCGALLLYRMGPVAGADLELRAEARNLFDVYYFAGGEGNAFFPGAERNLLVGARLRF